MFPPLSTCEPPGDFESTTPRRGTLYVRLIPYDMIPGNANETLTLARPTPKASQGTTTINTTTTYHCCTFVLRTSYVVERWARGEGMQMQLCTTHPECQPGYVGSSYSYLVF